MAEPRIQNLILALHDQGFAGTVAEWSRKLPEERRGSVWYSLKALASRGQIPEHRVSGVRVYGKANGDLPSKILLDLSTMTAKWQE